MNIEADELRDRMPALSQEELRAIIEAREDEYTLAEREAAGSELRRRSSQGAGVAAATGANDQPAFRDAGNLARAAQVLLATSVAIHVAEASHGLITATSVEELSILTPTHCSSVGWLMLIDLPALVVFCCWWYRVAANLSALQARELTYSPSESVWAFFIPFVNIVMPGNVGQEIWKASDPALTANDALHRRRMPEASVVSTWWTCLVVAGFMHSCKISGSEPVTYTVVAISYGLFAVSGIAAIRLVEEVQRRQNARWRGISAAVSAVPSAQPA